MMDENTRQRIQTEVDANDVLLFMKGTPVFPQCGFSAAVIQVLSHLQVKFNSVNVLEDMDIRERHRLKTNVPKTVLRVKVTQAHLHCGKSMLRGGLWDPRKWPGKRPIPTLFEMIEDQTGIDCEIKDEQKILAQYKKELY